MGREKEKRLQAFAFTNQEWGAWNSLWQTQPIITPPLSYILWPVTERLKGRGTEGVKGLEEGERSRVRNRCLEIRKKFKIREGEKKSGRKRQRERTRATDPHSKKQKCRQKRKVMHTQHGGRYLM